MILNPDPLAASASSAGKWVFLLKHFTFISTFGSQELFIDLFLGVVSLCACSTCLFPWGGGQRFCPVFFYSLNLSSSIARLAGQLSSRVSSRVDWLCLLRVGLQSVLCVAAGILPQGLKLGWQAGTLPTEPSTARPSLFSKGFRLGFWEIFIYIVN